MAEKMTPQQQQAVSFDEGNCLVSAGAGAGKTKVLTTRVSRLVSEGKAKLSELLVLTFTNKAAFEIKDRVRRAISSSSDPKLSALAPEVEGAMIATFDSFCLDLVTRYHYDLGIDKDISLVDKDIIDIQKDRCLKQLLEEHSELALAGKDEAFANLVSHLCVKDMKYLIGAIKDIDAEGNLVKNKKDFLTNTVEQIYSEEFFEEALKAAHDRAARLLEQASKAARLYEDPDLAEKDIAFIDGVLAEGPDYESLHNSIAIAKFPNARKYIGDDKNYREKVVRALFGKAAALVGLEKREARAIHLETKQDAETLFALAREFEKRMQEWKAENGAYSFPDIAFLARELVKDEEVLAKLRKRYRYAMIDEYQDNSDLQDQLIAAIGCPSLFMVGDIKQSIYRFRNANPKNFQAKMKEYRSGKEGALITLPDNFRSREQVIDGVNAIFKDIMSEEVGGVDYALGQALAFGNHGYDSSKANEDYGVRFYRYTPPEGSKDKAEAEIVAKDILNKIHDGFRLQDGRTCEFSDFAILTRSKNVFNEYLEAFAKYGIPLEPVAPKIDQPKDVTMVLENLLRLTNEYERGYPDPKLIRRLFVSIQRSYLNGKSDGEIRALIDKGNLLDDPMFAKIAAIDSSSRTLDELFDKLCLEFGIIEKLPLLGDIKSNYDAIEKTRALVAAFSQFHWGLDELVEHIDFLGESEEKEEEGKGAVESNAVKLMTIHASKGLEFPIVYLPYLCSSPKNNGGSVFSRTWGLLIPNTDESHKSFKSVFHLLDTYDRAAEDRSERMRLLYVALTRARELAIAILPKDQKPCPNLLLSRSFADFLSCSTYEDASTSFDADTLKEVEPKTKAKRNDGPSIELRKIAAKAKTVEVKRASKELKEPIDQGVLRYGEKLHRYMELTDVCGKDISWIEEKGIHDKIATVLALPVFKNAAKAKQFHEYAFLMDNGNEAVIDLFLLYDDHIDLVDFKASNIDDPAYGAQLETYASFLSKAFGLPVERYLVSISQGRQVKVG